MQSISFCLSLRNAQHQPRPARYEPGGTSRRAVDDWFHHASISLKPAMEPGSIEAIKQLIAAGLGCGLLPRLAVIDSQLPEELAIRSLPPGLHRHLGLVLRRDKTPNRALREVIAALRSLRHDGG